MSHGARENLLSTYLTARILYRELTASDDEGYPAEGLPSINMDYDRNSFKSPFGFNSALVLHILDPDVNMATTGTVYIWANANIENGPGPVTVTSTQPWSLVSAVPFTSSTMVVVNDLPANQYTVTVVLTNGDQIVLLEQHSA